MVTGGSSSVVTAFMALFDKLMARNTDGGADAGFTPNIFDEVVGI